MESFRQPRSQRAIESVPSDSMPLSASVDGRQTPAYAKQDASKRSLEGVLTLWPSIVVPPSIAELLAPAPNSPLEFHADTTAILAALAAELPAPHLGSSLLPYHACSYPPSGETWALWKTVPAPEYTPRVSPRPCRCRLLRRCLLLAVSSVHRKGSGIPRGRHWTKMSKGAAAEPTQLSAMTMRGRKGAS
ncbi:hypothetical protein CF326_g7574 [Tilletia indica]|nr:hypothetical protein CF326_g7574 [Tilletia indica]